MSVTFLVFNFNFCSIDLSLCSLFLTIHNFKAWIVIIFSMFSGSFVTWIVSVLILRYLPNNGRHTPKPSYSSDLFYFFATLSFQGKNGKFFQRSLKTVYWIFLAGGAIPGKGIDWHAPRIIVASWILMCVILFNTYLAFLVSFITAPTLRQAIESLADLAQSDRLQLAILEGSTFETIIMVH